MSFMSSQFKVDFYIKYAAEVLLSVQFKLFAVRIHS